MCIKQHHYRQNVTHTTKNMPMTHKLHPEKPTHTKQNPKQYLNVID